MKFKVGDWVVHEYNVVMIKRMQNGKVKEVSDGSMCQSSSDLTVFPLTLRNRYLVDWFHYKYEEIIKHGGRGLNYPDIHRYFSSRFNEACALPDSEKSGEKLKAIQDRTSNFVTETIKLKKAIDRVSAAHEAKVEAFNAFQAITEDGTVDCLNCQGHERIAKEWLRKYGAGGWGV